MAAKLYIATRCFFGKTGNRIKTNDLVTGAGVANLTHLLKVGYVKEATEAELKKHKEQADKLRKEADDKVAARADARDANTEKLRRKQGEELTALKATNQTLQADKDAAGEKVDELQNQLNGKDAVSRKAISDLRDEKDEVILALEVDKDSLIVRVGELEKANQALVDVAKETVVANKK